MWRRKWQPIPILLPGESHGERSLVGYSPWGRKESDTTKRLHFLFFHFQCDRRLYLSFAASSPLCCRKRQICVADWNLSLPSPISSPLNFSEVVPSTKLLSLLTQFQHLLSWKSQLTQVPSARLSSCTSCFSSTSQCCGPYCLKLYTASTWLFKSVSFMRTGTCLIAHLCIPRPRSLAFYSRVERLGASLWLSGKESACRCRRCRFDPWIGKIPEEGNGNPLQYACLGNPMDRGDSWAIVHGVTRSRTRLSN